MDYDVFLRVPEVMRVAGLKSRSTLHDWVARGIFPKPIKLSRRMVVWSQQEVMKWQKHRMDRRVG